MIEKELFQTKKPGILMSCSEEYTPKKNIEQGTIIDSKNFSELFYLAIPLQKGQISCREIINGISITQDISKDKPLTVDHIDGPYSTESDLKSMILDRGFEAV